MPAHILSLVTLESGNDTQASAKHLGRLRSHAALIRALADEVEWLSRVGDAEGLSHQLIEEMARLGCRLLETAGTLAGSRPPEDSGVFARRASRRGSTSPLVEVEPTP
jgi:hypothetical protein